MVITKLLSGVGNLFFPHLCLGCGSDGVSGDELLCAECHMNLPYTRYQYITGNKVEKIFYGRVPVTAGTSMLYFSKSMIVQRLLHELKYNGQKELGLLLGKLLGRTLLQSVWFESVDIIIPLPLSDRKKQLRGYNQSELLCQGIADITTKAVEKTNVIRNTDTPTQTRKHRRERWQNVEGIFGILNPSSLVNHHILLVDDVLTTGATLEACASAILRVPGTKVSVATLAIATR